MDLDFWMSFISFAWTIFQIVEKMQKKMRPAKRSRKKRNGKKRR